VVAAATLCSPLVRFHGTDRNADGRLDTWRSYDRQGQVSEVSVDTNFDGRADVQEFFLRGVLVRQESDRDFNDRVDLVEEFDPATSAAVRTVVDVDFDGIADLLVLFRDGQPVYSKSNRQARRNIAAVVPISKTEPPHRQGNDRLAPLEDPFSADPSIRAFQIPLPAGDSVDLSTSGGLPLLRFDLATPQEFSLPAAGLSVGHHASVVTVQHSPRGPPASFTA
jgi:hypothetical protein